MPSFYQLLFLIFFALQNEIEGLWIQNPSEIAGSYPSLFTTAFGRLPPRYPGMFNRSVVMANPPNGCVESEGTNYNGDVVLINRGICTFATKATIAQNQNASAVIFINTNYNNSAELFFVSVGPDIPSLDIVSVSTSFRVGKMLMRNLDKGLTVSLYSSPIQEDQRAALVDFYEQIDPTKVWANETRQIEEFASGNLTRSDPCLFPYTDVTLSCDEEGYITLLLLNFEVKGRISESIGKFKRLLFLQIKSSSLRGSIPDAFQNMTELNSVTLGYNLEGNLPPSLVDNHSLSQLVLSSNKLGGTLPPFNLPNARIIYLDSNQFEGRIPESITMNSTMLNYLACNSNHFSGSLPPFLPKTYFLLDFCCNRLDGKLRGIFNGTSSGSLILRSNRFEGVIPTEITRATELLDVRDNLLSGMETVNSVTLTRLYISNNPINSSLQINAPILSVFQAVNCGIVGFPVIDSTSLVDLDLSDNNLNSVINLGSLGYVIVSFKAANSSLHGDIVFNQLKLSTLSTIDLSNNNLSGILDPSGFVSLSSVDLSFNNFTGSLSENWGLLGSQFIYLNLEGNPRLSNGTNATTWGIPSWITSEFRGIIKQYPDVNRLCPNFFGVKNPFLQVFLPPTYYRYSLCKCYSNYYSSGEQCLLCPEGAFCQDGKIDHRDKGLSSGSIVGIVLGCLGFLAINAIVIAVVRRKAYRVPKSEFEMESIDYSKISLGEAKKSIIDFDEIEDQKLIGTGAYGYVYSGIWRRFQVAVKCLKTDQATEVQLTEFIGEVKILQNLRSHPNVLLFLGITFPPQPLALVTELCEGGSLFTWLRNNDASPDRKMGFLKEIARGMLHLHAENVIHRDLAVRNILLMDNLRCKVCDFGLSRVNDVKDSAAYTTQNVGPLKWMAPESIESREYSTKTDVFSFGVVIWEVVSVKEPWEELTAVEAAIRVVTKKKRLVIPNCDPLLQHIMKACWEHDPQLRPSFHEICTQFELNEDRIGSEPLLIPLGTGRPLDLNYSSASSDLFQGTDTLPSESTEPTERTDGTHSHYHSSPDFQSQQ